MAWDAPADAATTSYSAEDGERQFAFTATEDVELTGPTALRLWVSSTGDDVDVMLHIHVEDRDGNVRLGIAPQGGPIALAMGWLRASHRTLDDERALPYRPVHRHTDRAPLLPHTPVALDIEIWPTSITLGAGDTLVMRVRAEDDELGPMAHDDSTDRAQLRTHTTTLLTGGEYNSALLVP